MHSRDLLKHNPLSVSVFNEDFYEGEAPPPQQNDFILMSNENFLLMDGTNFDLIGN